MTTPTLAQARSAYDRQRGLSVLTLAAIRKLFAADARPTIPRIAATAAGYQLASATMSSQTVAGYAGTQQPLTNAAAFVGVSSLGFPLTEPIIATIDRIIPAPPEPLPAPWWDDAAKFMADLEQLLLSEVADAGRTASQVESVGRGWTEYIRMLNPPSCARCTILGGRVYRWNQGFDRHPLCDCIHVPVENESAAKSEGLISDPAEAFEKGMVGGDRTLPDGRKQFEAGLSRADLKAIADGADPAQVVNARRGLRAPGITAGSTTTIFGRRVKVTSEGTTKRAAWRRANPTKPVRLRPESIYAIADDHADAVRLLKVYGYIT